MAIIHDPRYPADPASYYCACAEDGCACEELVDNATDSCVMCYFNAHETVDGPRLPWIAIDEDGFPDQNGTYNVYAPSADPRQPFYATAYFSDDLGWQMIPDAWAKAITHWYKPTPPAGRV